MSYPVYGVARVDGTLHYLADTYVTGYHSFCGISDYFTDADIYSGKQFHLNNQLDDCLVPYIRSSKYDACAYELLLKYQPEALEEPCSVDAEKLANFLY